MFTGFATENTPAIQVWEVWRFPASFGANNYIALTDDCAPIQFFKTGAIADLDVCAYLPSAPIEGKSITIINAQYGGSKQCVAIYAAESIYGTGVILNKIGPGQKVTFVYSNASISSGTTNSSFATRWVALDLAHKGALNNGSAIAGGNDNSTRNSNCFVGGGSNNNATGSNSSVVGGGSNSASGSSSGVFGGSNSTASNSNASAIGCSSSNVSGFGAFAGGANQGTVSGNGGVILGGQACTASGLYSTVTNGPGNTANAECSVTVGGARGTTRAIVGNFVSTASVDTISTVSGISQRAALLLARQTTDATATRLTSNSSAGATTNQVILPNNSAYTFVGTCIANVTGGGNTSGWRFEGVIKRGATAASTALVAAVTPTVIAQDAGASTWVLAITADTTNGGIAVTVTGQAATTIRWVVQIETTEVTF